MNLFGIEIKFARKNNPDCYVKHEDCCKAQNMLKEYFNQRIEDLMKHIDTRFEDFKLFFVEKSKK